MVQGDTLIGLLSQVLLPETVKGSFEKLIKRTAACDMSWEGLKLC